MAKKLIPSGLPNFLIFKTSRSNYMFLRSLPLRLYPSGNSFMVPARRKSLPNENGGVEGVAGAVKLTREPGAATRLCPQQLLPWCSLLLPVIFAGTPTCCCRKGVVDHHG